MCKCLCAHAICRLDHLYVISNESVCMFVVVQSLVCLPHAEDLFVTKCALEGVAALFWLLPPVPRSVTCSVIISLMHDLFFASAAYNPGD